MRCKTFIKIDSYTRLFCENLRSGKSVLRKLHELCGLPNRLSESIIGRISEKFQEICLIANQISEKWSRSVCSLKNIYLVCENTAENPEMPNR